MPIDVHADLRRPKPDEFAGLAYDVMACAFQVHNEMGRFFDERIYKQVVARRLSGIQLEVPIIVSHDAFEQRYALDMLVRGSAVFEWKAVAALGPQQRAQLLNYLLLCDLPRGKLVNVRPALIEHEFVNTTLRLSDLREFAVDEGSFAALDSLDQDWKDFLIAGLGDWGAGLDLHLYEAAIAHVFGGEENILHEVKIVVGGERVGSQKARVTTSRAAIKVTALSEELDAFERHARRFLSHTTLAAVHWVNITRRCVSLKTLQRQEHQEPEDAAARGPALPPSSCH